MSKSILTAIAFVVIAAQQEVDAFSGSPLLLSARALPPSPTARAPTSVVASNEDASSGRFGPSLALFSTNGDDSISGVGDNKKIEGRKRRVIMGYKAVMISYLAVGISSAIKAGGLSTNVLCLIAGLIAMPAGISYILISAASHDRLGSDTYKRMNLALLENSLVGLSVVALAGGNKLLTLSYVLSAINTIKGFTYGVLGWEKKSDATLLGDLANGTKDTVKGFLSIPGKLRPFGYWALTCMLALSKLAKLKEIVQLVQANSVAAAGIAPLLARFNRLALLTLMSYTLKDAADRDRLGGTTFIQLNYLCALSMGVNAFFSGGMTTPIGALSAVFALFCAFNGITSYAKNQNA